MLDPSWPAALRQSAEALVDAAQAAGTIGPGDLVVLTSGSTGRPRAVVRTIDSWRASVQPLADLAGIGADDVVWVPGPLSSSLFLHGAWHAVQVGAQPVLQREPPAAATVLHAVPALLADALDAADAGALPALRTAVVAGDALPDALRERAAARGWRLVEYYGAAELSFVGWRDDHGPFRAFPGADVQVRAGTVWVRSPYLARGYLGTDAGPLRRDGEWATVGDRAEPAPGGFRLLGRADSAVTTGGHTVVAEEVEAALRATGAVRDVAVLGVPHVRLGAVLAAVVVPAGDGWRPALAMAARALPAPARPRRWVAADALPRTPAGKLDRAALRDLVAGPTALR